MLRFSTAVAFAALFHLSLGSFLLPSGLPDGIWSASLDDEEPVLAKIGDIPGQDARTDAISVPDGSTFNITKVDSDAEASANKRDTTGCTYRDIVPLHYYVGFVSARDACASLYAVPRTIYVWTAESAFWFLCNYRYSSYTCEQTHLDITLASIKYRCGVNRSGWNYLNTPDVSWGVEKVGAGVC